ncbi:succinic semialdehyde dehydrogenase [Flaviflexus equikiangi]|uniref:succinic semialdehyde dehydrogenase n=1 Tax=Flaviflexus equikiangi TaxID=2758573 RepID=UPI0015F43DC1|nr:succinic semialdehyde dehydrogenase [Flaviflexus equikiangi]
MGRAQRAIDQLIGDPAQWIAAPEERPHEDVVSPLDGATIASYPICRPEDVAAAIGRARAAQASWSRIPAGERATVLTHLTALVWRNESALLDLIQAENGKARSHAFEEVSDVAMTAAHYATTGPRALRSRRVPGALPLLSHTEVNYHPVGVVGVISPWNYPFTLAISDALAALMAGNAVVIKPDSSTVLCALAAKALLVEAGLPSDLVQVVAGPGGVLGKPLVDGSDYLMFTGSTKTGRILGQQAGERLIGYSAELGGKNPLIVLDDAPMGRAVRAAVKAVTSNSGQLCISIERIYVEDSAWDRFVPAFVSAMAAVKVRGDYSWSAGMGPLISARQLETVSAHVEDARGKGATVLAGGHALPEIAPYAYAPTVLTDVTEAMMVCREETFGPVVSLYRVADAGEAIARANDSDYGLNASIWTTPSRGRTLGSAIQAGTVNVNDGYIAAWASMHAPMGGMKGSGLGRRHGENGLLKYTEPQTVATSRILPLQAPPFLSEKLWARVMKTYLRLGR